MTRYLRYLQSIFSLRKLTYRDIAFTAYWDEHSAFTRNTKLGPFVRLLHSKIGPYTRISKGCSLLFTEVGRFCSFGIGVQLGAGRHPIHMASTSQLFYNTNSLKNDWVHPISYEQNLPISVGNDVWIGSNTLIMGGVTIGDGAVIGARSLVTKDIPPYAIAVGMPARVIKYRFEPEVVERLLEIQWWNFSEDEIQAHIRFFREQEINLEVLDRYFHKS